MLPQNNSFKYQERIVAFIDIMGFEKIIQNTEKSEERLNEICVAINYINTYFKDIKDNNFQDGAFEITQFSDSIIISVPMKESLQMISIFEHLKNIQIYLLFKGILLRGGIVKGKLIHNNNMLLGPGMNKAYSLESKCAFYPRIVIEPKVLWQFARSNGNDGLYKLKDYDYHKTFVKENDGTSFIDYFNDVEHYLNTINETVHSYFKQLCLITQSNIDSDDISIKMKYLWFREKIRASEYYLKNKTLFRELITNRNKK